MKITTIDNDSQEVFVTCPKCENCEGHPIHEQRHHLQNFAIVEWTQDEPHEVSHMKCHSCQEEFILVWKYKEEPELIGILMKEVQLQEVVTNLNELDFDYEGMTDYQMYKQFMKFQEEGKIDRLD